jgi:predicted anti-sigma-YlaC factor YlaD
MMQQLRAIECERTRQWISVALDSELSQFERSLVSGHVARCAACRSFEVHVTEVTREVRRAPAERMSARIYLPIRRRVAWRAAGVARVGSVAAVVVSAISIGLLVAPEKRPLAGEHALVAGSLEQPAGVNDLVIGLRGRKLGRGQQQAIAFGAGGIGAYKPALAPEP